MDTKGKQRTARVPKTHEQYVTQDGERLKYPLLMGNIPRISGIRTGKDEEFLGANRGKLSILQHKMA